MTEETANTLNVETSDSSNPMKFSVHIFEGISVKTSNEMPKYKIVLQYIFAVMIAVTVVNLTITALAFTPMIILFGLAVISLFAIIDPYTDSITVNLAGLEPSNIGDKFLLLVIGVTSLGLIETHTAMLIIDPVVTFTETYSLHISVITVIWVAVATQFNVSKYKKYFI